jgi:outer membrane protein OmpA-like peptidoglycan-associated protein
VQKKEPEKKKEPTPAEKKDSIAISRMKNVAVGETFAVNSVQFYGGSATLLPGAFPVLDGLVEQLKNNPNLEISIEGHICCYPTDEENLSEKRAKTVFNYLVAKSIDTSRLTYRGFGHTRPLTEERTAEEQQQNRRVEIRITKK